MIAAPAQTQFIVDEFMNVHQRYVPSAESHLSSRKEPDLRRIGVVGAGVIGSGVAHLFAGTGHEVVLVDSSSTQLQAAERKIQKNFKLYSLLQKEQVSAQPGEHLVFTQEFSDLRDADFVIENITEDWEMKRRVHEQLDDLLKPDTTVGANTSAIPITRFGSVYREPGRVVGMHFMNPVPLMPLVEVIRGDRTSERALRDAARLLGQAGREFITVNDSPGFVTNRVMMLMVNEAMFLVHEQVAAAQEVDRLFKTCFGHKMGPLETADLIGLDTVLRSLEVIYAELNDGKYRPCPLLRKMVYAGRHGRKSGEGFYRYET